MTIAHLIPLLQGGLVLATWAKTATVQVVHHQQRRWMPGRRTAHPNFIELRSLPCKNDRVDWPPVPSLDVFYTARSPARSGCHAMTTIAETEANSDITPGLGERLLIVEDEPATRLGLTELVRTWGFVAESASDGEEALRKVTTFRPPSSSATW